MMRVLGVPYHSQEDPIDAKEFGNDCGAACASMILEFYKKGRLSVNTLSEKTSLRIGDKGLWPIEVSQLLNRFGVESYVQDRVSLDMLKVEIDSGRPVIVLVRYGNIPRQNINDVKGGHYVVVTGYDDNHVIINDPDYWGSKVSHGAGVVIPTQDFIEAFSTYYPSNTAIMMRNIQASTEAAPTPTSTTRTVNTGVAEVTCSELRLRKSPNGDLIEFMPQGSQVQVLEDDPVSSGLYLWIHVNYKSESGWCAQKYLKSVAKPISTKVKKDTSDVSEDTGKGSASDN